jgi:3-oxoacyl-[acyl-carrier protein] reductase
MPHTPRRDAAHPFSSSGSTTSPTVLVTGGSRGIGRAICLEFGQAGWRVGVHYREREKEADQTAVAVRRSGGQAVTCRADIRDPRQVCAMLTDLMAHWRQLNVLVCNAGVASGHLLLRMNPKEWNAVLETNLTGTFNCVKAAGAQMLLQREGSVIVVGSFAAFHGQPGQSAYAASKAGLLGLVKTAAREWGTSNVRINAVLPGWHLTDMSESAMSDGHVLKDHVLGRSPDLRAVARTIYHLTLLEDVSGQVWNLDCRIL